MKVTGLKSSVPMSLFEPDLTRVSEVGVKVADAIVQADQGNCITLIVENSNLQPMCLKKGFVLGSIKPIESVLASQDRADQESEEIRDPQGQVNLETTTEAQVNLVETNNLPKSKLRELRDS